VIAFSGGRDSSLLLALATAVARRRGLPLPLPVTIRSTGPGAHVEDDWQELVIGHVKPADWMRIEIEDELDLLGALATGGLRELGVVYPVNSHFVALIARHHPGSTILNGMDADQIFDGYIWRRLGLLWAGAARPKRSDARLVISAMLPGGVRAARHAGRQELGAAWCSDEARENLRRASLRQAASEPVRWTNWLDWLIASREMALCVAALDAQAARFGARARFPFLSAGFLGALASYGPFGPGGRTRAYLQLGSQVLPRAILARETKAGFDAVFWGPASRRFVDSWDPARLTNPFVDAAKLAEYWLTDWTQAFPSAASALLLHQAWLETSVGDPV
jgi:asparagine synthetase B (glutamine-hydrolysing)